MRATLKSVEQMLRYSAYGLEIFSSFPLPEFEYGAPLPEGARTLTIHDAPVPRIHDVQTSPANFVFDASGSTFYWEGVGAFFVSPTGDEVRIERPADVDDALIAFPLLGPILSEVLRRQGLFTLHASASEIDGAGVILMADKGTGKSSSAGALLRGGARLLADDLVAIDATTGLIRSGFAQIKLEAPSLKHQLPKTNWIERPHVHDRIDKVRVLVPDVMAQSDIPARAIYVLERGTEPQTRFEALPADGALPAVLRFSFPPRFGKEALRGKDGVTHFRGAVAICQQVPVRRLKTPVGLERLDGLVDDIRGDLAALGE